MFKNVYTTRMSDDGKTLERRFKKLMANVSGKTKAWAIGLLGVLLLIIAVLVIFISRCEFASKNTDAYEIIIHNETDDIEYNERYEVVFRKQNGEILYTKTFDYRHAISEIGEGIYNVHFWFGTNAGYDVFIDIKNERVSGEYSSVLCFNQKWVAYCEEKTINVATLFGNDKIHMSFPIADISETFTMSSAITDAEIKGDKLCVTYLSGDDYKEVYKEFKLWEKVGDYRESETEITQTVPVGVSIFCNGEDIEFVNPPFYYNGDIYAPIDELFGYIANIEGITNPVKYVGKKIIIARNKDYSSKYEIQLGKNYISGDDEFLPVSKPVNAPMKYKGVNYIPMYYVCSMIFYNTVIDYKLTGNSEFVKKINEAIEFEKAARSWSEKGFTQQDLNDKAYGAYENWGRLLNEIMAELDEETLNKIDHPLWSKRCDTYMENEALPYEGGSMQPMVKYYAGAHFTRKRCEQLVIEFLV